MGIFLLDTDILTHLERSHSRVVANIRQHVGDTIATSTVTVEETLGGWYAQLRQAKTHADYAKMASFMAKTISTLGSLVLFPVTEPSLQRFDSLVRQKIRIGRNDLKIAALALELDATVVTNNLRDYHLVPGLRVENWLL